MAYLTWIVWILLFMVMVTFAAHNVDVVTVHGFLGYEWQASLVLVMFAAMLAGVVIGMAAVLKVALLLGVRRRQAAPPVAAEVMGPPAPVALHVARGTRDRSSLDEGA